MSRSLTTVLVVAALAFGFALGVTISSSSTASAASTPAACNPRGTLVQRVTCLEIQLRQELDGAGSGSVLDARRTVRNWCVWLRNYPYQNSEISGLLQSWKLSCSAFRR